MTFLLIALKAIRGTPRAYHRSFMDLARLKASLMYVKSIETFRLLFVSFLGVGISLVFLLSGLALFHTALFLYTPWTAGVKLWVGLFFALGYLLIALKAFSYIFSESQWLKIFHAADVMDDIVGKSAESPDSEKEFSRTKSTNRESGSHN